MTTCETCGSTLVDGACPKHALTARMRGSAVQGGGKPPCAHCGKVNGHHSGSVIEVATQCLWSQWEQATGSAQPFDVAHLGALVVWADANGASYPISSKPRRGHTKPSAPSAVPSAPSAPAPVTLESMGEMPAPAPRVLYSAPTPGTAICTRCNLPTYTPAERHGLTYCQSCIPTVDMATLATAKVDESSAPAIPAERPCVDCGQPYTETRDGQRCLACYRARKAKSRMKAAAAMR